MKRAILAVVLVFISASQLRAQNTIKIGCYEEFYLADAQMSVTVDGVSVAVGLACPFKSSTAPGFVTITGNFPPSMAHTVKQTFTNDAYGGTPSTDRNLYITSLSLDGTPGTAVSYTRKGVVTFGVPQLLLGDGDTGTWTTAIVAPPVNTTPPVMNVIAATVSLNGSFTPPAATKTVVLNWLASTSTVAGYNVYRSTTSGTGYAKLDTALVNALTYTDKVTNTSGVTYYYVVTAVNSNGNESAYSNEASATLP